MNLAARRLIAITLGLMLVAFGLYKIVMLMAFSEGFPMPSSTRENLITFATNTPNWQRYLLYALFAALPVIYAVLWRRARRADRMIRVAEGLYIRESAVSGFLSDAVTALEEVRAFHARCTMVKGKGLALDCRVELESQRQLGEVRERIVSAVRACMAERMAVIPVARVDVTVQQQHAESTTQSIARDAAVAGATGAAVVTDESSPPPPPPPLPSETDETSPQRRSIDLSPIAHDEDEDEGETSGEVSDDTSPISLESPLGRALLDSEQRRRGGDSGTDPLSE